MLRQILKLAINFEFTLMSPDINDSHLKKKKKI